VLINALSVTAGGGRSYIQNVLRELARDSRGLDFTVLTLEGQLSAAETSGLPVETMRLPSLSTSPTALARVLYEEALLPLRARRFDLLYCLADLAPALAATPTVVALRNLNIYDHRFYDTLRIRALERFVRLGVRRCRRILCPSRAAAESIAEAIGIPVSRFAVVPHGIAPEAFAGPAPAPAGAARYLFLSGAIERHKNFAVAIEALAMLADRSLELWIAGSERTDPRHARALRHLAAQRGVGARVRYLGAVPYREMLGYYRGAFAFVFPSWIETFGHPLLEAMLAGTPIVASDIGTFREIAQDVALFFPPESPDALAREIERVAAEPDAARARVALGRDRAAVYSWKRSVDRLCEVLAEALDAR
jgi:glycosyltransferase involved in cell wall biosynthesis